MKLIRLITFLALFSLLFVGASDSKSSRSSLAKSVYMELIGQERPAQDVFEKAYLGYIDLKLSGHLNNHKEILSPIDFRIHSNKKRLWVIDLKSKTILHHTFVAHGENSGKEYAMDFSNRINSHQSSLGFYITEETYIGKNGLSLRLRGLERKFNSNARNRLVVLHGADYAGPEYIKKHGLLGNSEGCPAVPMGEHRNIIEITKGGTCLFIYFPDAKYLENSEYMLGY